MEYDIYLRQLVTLCMHHKPEKPYGYKVLKKPEASTLGKMGDELKKKLEIAKFAKDFENRTNKQQDLSPDADHLEGGSQEEEKEEEEYEDEEGSDESVV